LGIPVFDSGQPTMNGIHEATVAAVAAAAAAAAACQ